MSVERDNPPDLDGWSAEQLRAFTMGLNYGVSAMRSVLVNALLRSAAGARIDDLAASVALRAVAEAMAELDLPVAEVVGPRLVEP